MVLQTQKVMAIQHERMSGEFEKFHLNADGSEPWPFRPVLHHFTGPDKGGPHDHPWDFTSYVLKGLYVERVYEVHADGWEFKDYVRSEGTCHTVKAGCIHEIIHVENNECWTMVISGPKFREPCFWEFDSQRATKRQWNEEHKEEMWVA